MKETFDMSDRDIKRCRIVFNSGYQLSIVQLPSYFCGTEGLCEIAIFNPDGEFNIEILGNQVKGNCTEQEVMEFYELCLKL